MDFPRYVGSYNYSISCHNYFSKVPDLYTTKTLADIYIKGLRVFFPFKTESNLGLVALG